MHNYVKWKQSTVQETTLPHYIRWVSLFQTYLDKENDFTLDDISNFKSFLVGALYSPKNIQYGLSIVRDYLAYLMAVEGLEFPLHLFRIKMERSTSHHAATEQEYQKMLAVLPINQPITLQRRLMLMLLHDTGMRVGELMNLKLSDVKERHAIINNEKNKRQRLVAWTEKTHKILVRYMGLRENLICTEDYLFVSFWWKKSMTRKMTTRQVERWFREVCDKAGITTSVRPHSFRHGFVHRRLDEGKPITTVAQMLGHSTTLNVLTYAQLSSREIRDAWNV